MGECPKCLKEIYMLVKHYIEKIESEEYVSIATAKIGDSYESEYLESEDYEQTGCLDISGVYYTCPECGIKLFGDAEEKKIIGFLRESKNSVW